MVGVLSVALGAALIVLLPPARSWWRQAREPVHLQLLVEGGAQTFHQDPAARHLSPEEFASFLATFDTGEKAETPKWRFGALLTGYLRLYGVPLWEESVAYCYSTQTRDRVRLEEGETWESLAETYMGASELWPMLMLLNFDWVAKEGVGPSPGWVIQVPMVPDSDP